MPKCKLKNCPYNQDGRCIENQLPNCPNLVPDDAVNAETSTADISTPPETTTELTQEPLYSGKKLTIIEIGDILRARPAHIVVFGGMVESGKTTLIARIFEMFQCGPVCDHNFAGSRTLVELDKFSWLATMESGESTPKTEHTSRAENNLFIHIQVRGRGGADQKQEILIADIPGEVFPEAVAEERICRELFALQRADHLILLLDGGVIVHPADRHDHCGKVFDFARRALGTGQIGKHTTVHLVISKTDLLPSDQASDAIKFVLETEEDFRKQFSAQVGALYNWRLAARPQGSFQATIAEIHKLVSTWMTSTYQNAPPLEPQDRSKAPRAFFRFGT